jgi:hypothetical protein
MPLCISAMVFFPRAYYHCPGSCVPEFSGSDSLKYCLLHTALRIDRIHADTVSDHRLLCHSYVTLCMVQLEAREFGNLRPLFGIFLNEINRMLKIKSSRCLTQWRLALLPAGSKAAVLY